MIVTCLTLSFLFSKDGLRYFAKGEFLFSCKIGTNYYTHAMATCNEILFDTCTFKFLGNISASTDFFKQKTAYEILGCDWSSDVCSSDLPVLKKPAKRVRFAPTVDTNEAPPKIGRASCRERV